MVIIESKQHRSGVVPFLPLFCSPILAVPPVVLPASVPSHLIVPDPKNRKIHSISTYSLSRTKKKKKKKKKKIKNRKYTYHSWVEAPMPIKHNRHDRIVFLPQDLCD